MKICRHYFLLAFVATVACNSSASDDKKLISPTDSINEEVKSNQPAIKKVLGYEEVLGLMFEAARSGDYHRLPALCGRYSGEDAVGVCHLADTPPETQEQFRTQFAKSKILEIAGPHPGQSTIRIKISYGKDGKKWGWVECKKNEDDSWYLSGMDDEFVEAFR